MTDDTVNTLEVDVPPDELFLIPDEVSAELGVSRGDLRRMREAGIGPAYFTIGQTIRYLPADVETWRLEHPAGVPLPRRGRLV